MIEGTVSNLQNPWARTTRKSWISRIVGTVLVLAVLGVLPGESLAADKGSSENLEKLDATELSSVNGEEGFKFDFEVEEMEVGAVRLEDSDNFGEFQITDLVINRWGETTFTLDVDGSDGLVVNFPTTKGLRLDIGTNELLLGSPDPGPSLAAYGVELNGTDLNISSH